MFDKFLQKKGRIKIKKKIISFIIIVALLLTGIVLYSHQFKNENSTSIIEGTVIETDESFLLLKGTNDEIYKVDENDYSNQTINEGDFIQVKYDGIVLETYPATFNNIFGIKKQATR